MTPKERYEARKAERRKLAEDMHNNYTARKAIEEADMLDMFDRFVTAAERIADALDRPQGGAVNNMVASTTIACCSKCPYPTQCSHCQLEPVCPAAS
jgi:hypothetical protein